MSDSVELLITGMTCSGCASTVTRVLSRVAGVTAARVDLESGRASVAGSARAEDLMQAVEAAGYEVARWTPESSRSPA
jgi:copper chaperone CopZ